jgi:tyrosine-protein kinase Etk/Wzc
MSTQIPVGEHSAPPDIPILARQVSDNSVQADQISILDLATMVVQRRRFVLWTAGIIAIIAAAVALLLPNWYTANVSLLPPQQSSSLSAALASQLGSLGSLASMAGGGLGIKNPNDMYVAMLQSRTVEDAMIQRFGLVQQYRTRNLTDTRKVFERHAKVDGSQKDGLIHISFEDRNANRAATLANAYVDEFRDLSKHLAISEASQRRMFLEQQLAQSKDNLARAEENLKETEQKTGLIQLDNQARALIESAAALRAQVAAKEVQIQSLRTFATDENSQLVQAQQELESLQAQLAKLGGNGQDTDASFLVPKGRVPEAGLEYVRKLREVKYYEAIFEILARQFEAAKLDEAKQGAVIQVVDAAVPPDKKSFPMRSMMVLIAGAAGLLLGSFIVVTQSVFRSMLADAQTGPGLRRFLQAFRRNSSRAYE